MPAIPYQSDLRAIASALLLGVLLSASSSVSEAQLSPADGEDRQEGTRNDRADEADKLRPRIDEGAQAERPDGGSIGSMSASTKVYDQTARDELSHNDIRAFVYQWFANFDHQVSIEELLPHIVEPVDMAFPGLAVQSSSDFANWYQDVEENIQWNNHDVFFVEVSGDERTGWQISLGLRWRAITYDGDLYDDLIYQYWELERSDAGGIVFRRHRSSLGNPFDEIPPKLD